MVTAQRKKMGSGGWFSEAVLEEGLPMWIQGGVELQQVWQWRPRGGPRPLEKVRHPPFEVGAKMEGTKVVAEMKEKFP